MVLAQCIWGGERAREQNYSDLLRKVCEEVYASAMWQRSGLLTLPELVRAASQWKGLRTWWVVRGKRSLLNQKGDEEHPT